MRCTFFTSYFALKAKAVFVACVLVSTTSSCTVRIRVPSARVATNAAPDLDSFSVTNSAYTNSVNYGLSFSVSGSYDDYCILENDTTQSNCVWTLGTIPSSYTVTSVENAKVLSLWVRNAYGISSRLDSNSVTLDTTPPTRPTALALSSPASSPDTDTTPTISMASIEAQASVQLYSNNTCTTQVGSLSNAGAGGTVIVTANALTTATYTFYATQTDRATNVSPCSLSTVTYQLNPATAVLTIAANTFSDTIVGANTDVTFTATNSGTGAATLGAGSPATLTTGTHYSITGGTCTASATIAVSGTCTIIVRFAPSSNGVKNDTINLAYNDGSANQNAIRNITGTGLNPANLSFNLTEVYFGKVLLGGGANPGLLTISNSGDVAATLTNPTLNNITSSSDLVTASTEFKYDNGTFPGSAGNCTSTIAAGASCTVSIIPTPTLEGQQWLQYGFQYNNGLITTAEVSIPISYFGMRLLLARPNPTQPWTFDAGSFQSPSLSGYAYVPVIVVNPSDYPESFSFDLVSCSSGDWVYTGAGAFPGDGSLNSEIPLCGATIDGKSKCRVEMWYRPATAGVKNCGLAVNPTHLRNTSYTPITTAQLTLTANTDDSTGTACACNPADSVNFGGGAGSLNDPWQVCSAAHLDHIHSDFDANSGWSGKYFMQCGDIATGQMVAIGTNALSDFEGTYDGLGRRITFRQQSLGTCDLGLFARIGVSGEIRNLGIWNYIANLGNIPNSCSAGPVAAINKGLIKNVWSTNQAGSPLDLQSQFPQVSGVGGLVGSATAVARFQNSWSSVSFTGSPDGSYTFIGGLVGGESRFQVSNSFFAGKMDFSENSGVNSYAGIAWRILGNGSQNLFNVADITSVSGGDISGLAAYVYADNTHQNFSNYGNLYSGSSVVSGVFQEQIAALGETENLFNYGDITANRPIGVLGTLNSGTQASHLLNFGDITMITSNGGGTGLVRNVDGSLTDAHTYGNFFDSTPTGDASFSGITTTVSGSGSISNSSFIGSVESAGMTQFFGIAESNSGSIDHTYTALIDAGNGALNGDLCIGSTSGLESSLYTWDERGGTDVLGGRFQDHSASLGFTFAGCTRLSATEMIDEASFVGFDFSTIWQIPGFYWPTPGLQ